MNTRPYIDSWDPFNLSPRTRWYQGLYVGLLWSALGWGVVILFLITVIKSSQG